MAEKDDYTIPLFGFKYPEYPGEEELIPRKPKTPRSSLKPTPATLFLDKEALEPKVKGSIEKESKIYLTSSADSLFRVPETNQNHETRVTIEDGSDTDPEPEPEHKSDRKRSLSFEGTPSDSDSESAESDSVFLDCERPENIATRALIIAKINNIYRMQAECFEGEDRKILYYQLVICLFFIFHWVSVVFITTIHILRNIWICLAIGNKVGKLAKK